jgi:hypothetical protein
MRFISFALFSLALSTLGNSDEIQHMLAKYDDIEYSHQYGEFYRSLYAACDSTTLVRLTTNSNDSIATQSAWETVTLSVPEEDGPKVYRPDSKKLAWFVGFLEGRNKIVVPEWWREIVLDARANRRNNIYPGKSTVQPYHRSDIEWVRCPVNASVIEKDRVVTYRTGQDSITLPEELLDRSDSGNLSCNISCTFTETKCFVAIHDDVGYSHDVACVDRETNTLVWKSEACGSWWGGATGQHESWVTVVPTDNGHVFVFGASSIGFYTHGFDTNDGKTLLRFSNNY